MVAEKEEFSQELLPEWEEQRARGKDSLIRRLPFAIPSRNLSAPSPSEIPLACCTVLCAKMMVKNDGQVGNLIFCVQAIRVSLNMKLNVRYERNPFN